MSGLKPLYELGPCSSCGGDVWITPVASSTAPAGLRVDVRHVDAERAPISCSHRSSAEQAAVDEIVATHARALAVRGRVGRPEIGPAFSLRFPVDLLERTDSRAATEGISRAELVRRAVDAYLGRCHMAVVSDGQERQCVREAGHPLDLDAGDGCRLGKEA